MASTQKTALVTGASSGMGKVIAKQLIRDGLTVIVAARRVEQIVNRRCNGTPYRLPKGTPASGCIGSARVGPELSI